MARPVFVENDPLINDFCAHASHSFCYPILDLFLWKTTFLLMLFNDFCVRASCAFPYPIAAFASHNGWTGFFSLLRACTLFPIMSEEQKLCYQYTVDSGKKGSQVDV